MQIHELTQYQLQEGFLDTLKSVGKNVVQQAQGDYSGIAAKHAADAANKGYGAQYRPPSDKWQDKLKDIGTNPSVKQYIQSLVVAWPKFEKERLGATPIATNTPTPASAGTTTSSGTPAQQPKATEPLRIGKDAIDPNDPANQALIAKLKQQGHINEAVNSSPTDLQYARAFTDWADEKLKTRESTTGTTIEMDNIKNEDPSLGTELNNALDKVVATKGTPQQVAALTSYFTIAVAGVQAAAQALRNKSPAARGTAIPKAMAAKTELQTELNAVGISPAKLKQIGEVLKKNGTTSFKYQNNPQLDALLLSLGLIAQ